MSELHTDLPIKILFVHQDVMAESAAGRAGRALVDDLNQRGYAVLVSTNSQDAQSIVASDPLIGCLLLDWDLEQDEVIGHREATAVLSAFRARNDKAPVFLIGERSQASDIPLPVLEMANDFIWLLEDTPTFISGRIEAAIRRYGDLLLPPMFDALIKFAQLHEYSWHTPGHTGGTAFLKTPVSHVFYNYFGENMLRSDLSISVGELGSLLDHSGPIGAGEQYAARVFGAHRSYTVTNGTSTSNRVVFMASLTEGDIALCDRNCHKSIEHGLTLTGAIPIYLIPHRNRYGIIGPIYPERLRPEAIQQAIAASPLAGVESTTKPTHVVITNSTYDGLCYEVTTVLDILDATVDRIHFDEAWYGYARFNPLYRNRHAMFGDPEAYKSGPTLFATQSTHKLLAALSQASFIHIREGRAPIEHDRFNESFMLHASTSPLYSIIASNDISAAMMDGASGVALTTESIREAVAFRQTIGRIRRQLVEGSDWFFATWNPDHVTDPNTAQTIAFDDAPEELLTTDPSCWVLHPKAKWHGFDGLQDDYCMLDPIKVTVLTPSIADDGSLAERGIPASLVTAYLDTKGVEVEKTQDFSILFLFSIGVTKGKWGTLVTALLEFKRDYDRNAALADLFPELVASAPGVYAGRGLRDLANAMFAEYRRSQQMDFLEQAFSTLPVPALTPASAYRKLVRDEIEHVALDKLAGRVVATGVVPYPPGIPMLMPGELAGAAGEPYIGYLKALRNWDRHFPGFGHDTHGVEMSDGEYYIYCIKE